MTFTAGQCQHGAVLVENVFVDKFGIENEAVIDFGYFVRNQRVSRIAADYQVVFGGDGLFGTDTANRP